MSEDFRMGFDAGTRSCQHMMQLRIDELQTRLAAAEAQLAQGVAHARERIGLVQDVMDLSKRLAAAEQYREHHEFVMQQVSEMAGVNIATSGDYIALLKQTTERLAAAEAEIVNAREAARLVFHKATFIGTAKEHNRFPGWQKIAEMYTWLAQQEDDTAAKGGRDE